MPGDFILHFSLLLEVTGKLQLLFVLKDLLKGGGNDHKVSHFQF